MYHFSYFLATRETFVPFIHKSFGEDFVPKLCLKTNQNFTRSHAFKSKKKTLLCVGQQKEGLLLTHGEWVYTLQASRKFVEKRRCYTPSCDDQTPVSI